MEEVCRYTDELRADPRSTAELLKEAPFDRRATSILMARADQEAFDGARELCRSPIPHEREAGAHILGQMGLVSEAFLEESVAELIQLLAREPTLAVTSTALFALGHRGQPAAVAAALPFTTHPCEDIRYAATFALLTQEDPQAIEALIRLSRDEDDDVRNWATFGLGSQIELDTPEIRQALHDRLEEPDDEIRGEALVGLAKRKDPVALEALKRELALDDIGTLAVEAAEALGHPELLPYLERIAEWWDVNPSLVASALEACRRERTVA